MNPVLAQNVFGRDEIRTSREVIGGGRVAVQLGVSELVLGVLGELKRSMLAGSRVAAARLSRAGGGAPLPGFAQREGVNFPICLPEDL